MIFSPVIQKAIRTAVIAHKDQKRKIKSYEYISHPLTVGLIVSKTGTEDDVVAAGILHDTIEDTAITYEDLVKDFGKKIADMVNDVTEQNKALSWEQRKLEILERIKNLPHESLLIKSADILHNMTDLLDSFKELGEEAFQEYGREKESTLANYRRFIDAIGAVWSENPLLPELKARLKEFIEKASTK